MNRTYLVLLILLNGTLGRGAPIVEVEEIVTRCTPANNGASPLWCYGSALIARIGNEVYLSTIETGKDIPPPCNTRWQIWHRSDNGAWKIAQQAGQYTEREPCPIGVFRKGTIFLSVNPSNQPPGMKSRDTHPQVLEFHARNLGRPFRTCEPVWAGGTHFSAASYRGLAADPKNNELLLLHCHTWTGDQFVSYRDRFGKWDQKGKIRFPIRACYPQVALKDKAAHVLAIGDIVEPNEAWRKLKLGTRDPDKDYVFRRLFYTYTPNIEQQAFVEPIEIDSVEKTAGHMRNLDLYVDNSGTAHALYLKRPYANALLRDTYYPGQPMTVHLEYMVIENGKVVAHRTLAETPMDGTQGLKPSYGRFHTGKLKNLYVVVAGTLNWNQQSSFGNFLAKIDHHNEKLDFQRIPLKHPFSTFFTNTPRGGSQLSDTIDLFGAAGDSLSLRYARVRNK